MLRIAVIAVGGICILGGAAALVAGFPGGWAALGFGAVLLLGTLYERVRYKPVETGRPGPGWQRTAERFFDEDRGKPVTVYIHPETGERRYVED